VRTLVVEYMLKESTAWAPSGYIMAADEIVLPAYGHVSLTLPRGAKAAISTEGPSSHVSAGKSTFQFERGQLSRWRYGDVDLLAGAIRAEFFRAATDNDRGGGGGSWLADWERAGVDRMGVVNESVETELSPLGAGAVRVRTRETYVGGGQAEGAGIEVTTVYEIAEGGVLVEVTAAVDADMPCLPRVGLRLVVPGWAERVRWLGRGPHENYADRKASAFFGRYESTIDALSIPYIYPAEHGGRADVTHLELLGGKQRLVIDSDTPLQMNVARFTTEDLHVARHTVDLPRRNEVYVYLDHRHMGVGGDIGWGKSVREPYLVKPGVYRWALRLSV
jgi:beta-galactosidase